MKAKSLSKQAQARIARAGRGRIVLARANGKAGHKLIFATPDRVGQIADKVAEGWSIVEKGK